MHTYSNQSRVNTAVIVGIFVILVVAFLVAYRQTNVPERGSLLLESTTGPAELSTSNDLDTVTTDLDAADVDQMDQEFSELEADSAAF